MIEEIPSDIESSADSDSSAEFDDDDCVSIQTIDSHLKERLRFEV